MSAISNRLREIVSSATNETDRYKALEELTGLNRASWMSFMKGKQNATLEMVEAACRAWEKWMPYIVLGKGEKPEMDKAKDTYYAIQVPKAGITLKRDKNGDAVTNVHHSINLRAPYTAAKYEWGYVGEGPKQLAVDILAQFGLDEDEAKKHAKKFADDVLSTLPHADAFLSATRVKEWISDRNEALRKLRATNGDN